MNTCRISIEIENADGEVGSFVTVDGMETDAKQLHRFLDGLPVSRVDGTPSGMLWRVTAEVREPDRWTPFKIGEWP